MDDATKVFVLNSLAEIHCKGVYPEALGGHRVTEQKFSASPDDLVYNMREALRSRQARKMARLGYPLHRNSSESLVLSNSLHHWP